MLQKLKTHIDTNFSFLKDKKLLIAISGGVDSVVLTHLLQQLEFNISLAHCNFQLRSKESDADEVFVKNLGNHFNLKTFTTQFNTKEVAEKLKLSIQVTARELRYKWFQELATKHQYDYVLTAHHANDNLETFIINLTRGTGLDGLTGIPAINGNIIRPLLPFSRDEILQYANDHNLDWREDASNAETKYLRNKVRHEIVPKLKEINPNFFNTFEKTTSFLGESQQIIEDRINELEKELISEIDGTLKFDVQKLRELHNPKAYIYHLFKEYGFTEYTDILNLLSAQSGKQVFSKNYRLLKDRDFLLLTKIDKKAEKTEYYIEENQTEISEPIDLSFSKESTDSQQSINSILVDKDLLKYPLIVRKWGNGDYICPIGMKGRKKLSKFFKDEKYSLLDKENTWLLCSTENEIIWIIGKRQDRRFAISKNTTNILKITN